MKIKQTILIICIVISFFFLNAPVDFPIGTIVEIEQGMGLRSVSLKLKNENIIRSRLIFEAFVILYGGEKHLKYSDYLFEENLPVYRIAARIVRGEHGMVPNSITIPEGFNVTQIADAFSAKLENFNKEKFLLLTQSKEGYLFPDTYFFLKENDEQDVLLAMNDNFEKKVNPLRARIASSGKTEREIIIMASLVEGEAKGDSDREYISGILWRRFSIGIPLQVDVAPVTYEKRGLPQDPVGNPGLEAIRAAISPKNSNYLYYLHDAEGNIYYARTFEEHRQNVLKYLK